MADYLGRLLRAALVAAALCAMGHAVLAHGVRKGALVRIDLNTQNRADRVAFLKTLTEREFLANPALSDPFRKL